MEKGRGKGGGGTLEGVHYQKKLLTHALLHPIQVLWADLLFPSVSSFHDLFTTSECDLVYSYNVNKHILFSLHLSYI